MSTELEPLPKECEDFFLFTHQQETATMIRPRIKIPITSPTMRPTLVPSSSSSTDAVFVVFVEPKSVIIKGREHL